MKTQNLIAEINSASARLADLSAQLLAQIQGDIAALSDKYFVPGPPAMRPVLPKPEPEQPKRRKRGAALTGRRLVKMHRLIKSGLPKHRVATLMGVSESTVYAAMRKK